MSIWDADLPVQAPTKYEFAINLKTAKELGLTIRWSTTACADGKEVPAQTVGNVRAGYQVMPGGLHHR